MVREQGRSDKAKLFWSGSKDAANEAANVLFSSLVDKVLEVKRESDRLIVLKIIIGLTIFTVVSAHAPRTGRAESEKTAFIEELDLVLNNAIIVEGDMN